MTPQQLDFIKKFVKIYQQRMYRLSELMVEQHRRDPSKQFYLSDDNFHTIISYEIQNWAKRGIAILSDGSVDSCIAHRMKSANYLYKRYFSKKK